jgi:signal transduction histidine kinase
MSRSPDPQRRSPEPGARAARRSDLLSRQRLVVPVLATGIGVSLAVVWLSGAPWAVRAEGLAIGTIVMLALAMLGWRLFNRVEQERWAHRQAARLAHLRQQRQAQATERQRSAQELARRERIMHSLFEDLQVSNERLEAKADELQQANARLQELGTIKDELIAKVSHELCTPLTSLKEGLNLLEDDLLGPTSAEQQDFLRAMQVDVSRLAEFVTTMLDLSRIEAGRLRFQRRAVELRQVVGSTISSYRLLVGRRAVRLEGGDVAQRVFADADRLHQVVTNLFSNALKATSEDGLIVFRLGQREGLATLAVEDNGIGIGPEELPKLFQKFSQVGSLSAGRPGTGLGLVFCKELVELHGGRIEVASTLGQGTTFTVLLPHYSDAWALTDSVRELREAQAADGQVTIGLVVISLGEPEPSGGPAAAREMVERVAEAIRPQIHRGDLLLVLDTLDIVVMVATDAAGLKGIIRRLGQGVGAGVPVRFGAAVTSDGDLDGLALYARAKERLGQGAALAALV